MTYEEYMSLGLLPANDPQAVQAPVQRDALSEAHSLQIMLNAMFAPPPPTQLYPFGNYYGPGGTPHYGVLPNLLTSEGAFAGHVVNEAVAAPTEHFAEPYPIDAFDELFGSTEPPADPEYDPFAHPTGISTDPGMGFFDEAHTAPAIAPDMLEQEYLSNPQVYGWDDSIAGVADLLGPSVSQVSRLGGPFAGYSPDALTSRLRELVRRA